MQLVSLLVLRSNPIKDKLELLIDVKLIYHQTISEATKSSDKLYIKCT